MNAIARISIAGAVGLVCLPAAVPGQDTAPPRAPAARAPAPEPVTGIAPERSGRAAGPVFVADRAALAAGAIPAGGQRLPVTAAANAVVPGPFEGVTARLLDHDMTATSASLNHCRIDAGPRKRAPPAHITLETLTLRRTIAGKGQVAAMDVVGSTPLDPDVLDCIKRDTNGWLFMSPAGGEARLNRALVFRRLAPTAARP
jgi:hypothetical protein